MSNKINRLQLHSRNFIQSKKYKINDDYIMGQGTNKVIQQLGSGTFGTVFVGICKINKKIRAIKQIKRKAIKNKVQFLHQIQILKKLDHPNIIKIYETYQDQQNYYIVTDFCEGGQLFNKIIEKGSFSEHDAKQIFRQMVYAIKYCHGQKIAHRDLKPQNFVFLDKQSYSLKLIDFGSSYKWKQDMRSELKSFGVYKLVGSPHYIAPEIIKGYYCEKCDIWSLGIILQTLLSALQPFDGLNDKKVLRSVKRGIYMLDIPQMKKVSEQAKDLIRCIIQPESHRYSIQQILAHPWMTNQVSNKNLNINFNKNKKFYQLCHLKKFAKNYIVSQLTGKQVEHLGQIFKQIDTDLDGYISTSQLKKALDRQKQKLYQPQLTQVLQILDKQKNGKISYHQFITFFSQTQSLLQQQNLKFVFISFDTDQDDKISLDDFKNGFQNANYYINQQSYQDMIRRYDKNNDGKVDYDQFVITLKNI